MFHGSGQWDVEEFLPDDLAMAFREPKTIATGRPSPLKPCLRDPPDRIAELALKWDNHSLLFIHNDPVPEDGLVRIFNARKSAVQDRQIGDKRGQNGLEAKVIGPSADLPSGVDVGDLYVNPAKQYVAVSISDRRDFIINYRYLQKKQKVTLWDRQCRFHLSKEHRPWLYGFPVRKLTRDIADFCMETSLALLRTRVSGAAARPRLDFFQQCAAGRSRRSRGGDVCSHGFAAEIRIT